jgi:hypothetical protein
MSVTEAPRARMAVNASWPGVSMKVILAPSRFAGGDIGRTQRIQQRRLAVVDMAHNGDHRWAWLQLRVAVRSSGQAEFDVGFGNAAGTVAKFLYHQFGGIGIERLGDGGHHAELHQRLHYLAGACGHSVGQLLHRDAVRQNDVAHDLDLIGAKTLQLGLTALALPLAADRGQRADTFVLALDRSLYVDAARAASTVRALLGNSDLRLARHQHAARAADRPGFVIIFRRTRARPEAQRLSRSCR